MPQVIIVSNRLPVSVKKENGKLEFFPSVGGLATGLSSYVNDKQSLWIGWPGIASDELSNGDREEIVEELAKHNCSPVFLTQRQIDDFYNGYSNVVLWPLFHRLRPQDQPGARRDRWYKTYRAVNKLFAEIVEVAANRDARVWVHDYQLLLVPEMLRTMKLDATIGFFLHIPFPDLKKFASLPDHRKILKGVLGADLIGFHTPGYVKNFQDACEASGLGTVEDEMIRLKDRSIRVSDFPMGIDYEKYADAGKKKSVKRAIKEYKRAYKGKKIIVAVDRLDPSKGLVERLNTYEEFLTQHHDLWNKVVFVMVAAPSRTDVPAYKRLAKRLDRMVEEINNRYGNDKWQPVDYINRTVPFERVTALFQIADVAFIAPLRDGMNLAAKEYVASAQRNGALILSETAGAATELRDALIVNPHKPETVVRALYRSLTMHRWELRRRLKRMRKYLKSHTVQNWAGEFVSVLNKPLPSSFALTRTINQKADARLVDDYSRGRKRLFLLDYDGSLVPFTNDPKQAAPSKELMSLLRKLSKNPKNDVVIISGRSAEDLERWFGKLPVSLVAEHGSSTKLAGKNKWKRIAKKASSWQRVFIPILEKYTELTPGAKLEVKAHSLVWHYRAASPYYAQKYSVIIRRTLKPALKSYGLGIMKGNKVLEIKDPHTTKGAAAKAWLDRGYDFVFGVGDDVTDEDMFHEMTLSMHSVKVGRGRTAARHRVRNHQDVLKLLRKLADS